MPVRTRKGTFALLKLPFVPIRRIVFQMDEISIVQMREFAGISDKIGVLAYAPETFHVSIYDTEATVIFGTLNWTFLTFESRAVEEFDDFDRYEMKTSRTIPKIVKKNERSEWFSYTSTPYSDAMFLVKHLIGAFLNAHITRLEMGISAKQVRRFFKAVHHSRVDFLEVESSYAVQPSQMATIMRRGKKIKDFSVWCPVENFEWREKFVGRSLSISAGTWFTFANLMDTSVEQLELHRPQFDNQDVNAFLKLWREGKHEKLKYFTIFSDAGQFCKHQIGNTFWMRQPTENAVLQFKRVRRTNPTGYNGCTIYSNSKMAATIWVERNEEGRNKRFVFIRSDF